MLHFFTPATIRFEFLNLKDLRESNMKFGDVVDWLLGAMQVIGIDQLVLYWESYT